MGKVFAEKANAATGPVAFLIPLRGVSILDGDGELFCDRATDQVMFDAIKAHLREGIPVHEIDHNINDPEFSAKATELMFGSPDHHLARLADLVSSSRHQPEGKL